MKDIKIIFGIFLTFIFLASIGFSYAYFTSAITNKDVKDQIVETGTLSLRYVDGPEIVMNNIKPGATITKTVYVANTGTLDASYNLVWQELVNEITNDEMVIEATCTRMNGTTEEVDGECKDIYNMPIAFNRIKGNISIEPNMVHKYDITITFKETNSDQNYNQGKKFNGVLGVEEYTAPEPIYCTFDGEMVQGAEYVNGQYTYRYMQQYQWTYDGMIWDNISGDGWGVMLTDRKSTVPVISELCTYINDKPLLSTSYMFWSSSATKIDVSNFNTSNVTNMQAMFLFSNSTILDISGFDTSKVTDMSNMFRGVKATTLDVSKFNTNNVTNMSDMFSGAKVTALDVSNFDTKNVTDMSNMFSSSQIDALDISNFDTSNVIDMSSMFSYIKPSEIKGLNKLNTSNVTDMSSMFSGSKAETLDLSNFNTSSVTNMRGMFWESQAKTLDLSNFDTLKVTDMGWMFYRNNAINIIGLEEFNTSNVTNMGQMFYNSQAETLDLSSFDTSKVTDMRWMFRNSKATTINIDNFNTSKITDMSLMFDNGNVKALDLSSFNTSKVTNMSEMFGHNSNLETITGLENFDTSSVTDMSYMFVRINATILDVSSFDTSNVTDMQAMFSNSKVETLDLSNFDTSKVKNMNGMFYFSKIISLDLSSFDTSNVTDMGGMFWDSNQLKTIYVGNSFITSKVTYSHWMFKNCTSLVGGAGTKYNSSYEDKTYARIDGGTGSRGYFTLKQ